MGLDSLYASLNDAQREAVFHQGNRPLLVLAGAGSGKTRVITLCMARLIEQEGFSASSILGFTFTNKVAKEMQERVSLWLGESFSPTLKTFHSFGSWFLRRYATLAGLSENFSIWDPADVMGALKNVQEFNVELFAKVPYSNHASLRSLAQAILSSKEAFETSEKDLRVKYEHLPYLSALLHRYEEYKRSSNAFDFSDLICEPIKILRAYPLVKQKMQRIFKAIFVDEYQDTNYSQFLLLKELVGASTFLCAVGDEDQCIYSFRGARLENILQFQEHFKNTKIIRLEENYRSTSNIIQASSRVIANNKKRLGKTLFTRQEAGENLKLYMHEEPSQEASFWASKFKKEKDLKYTRAVIYRTNKQSRAFEEALGRAKLAYKVLGSLKFYEREEIKDALAYLKCLSNPQDQVAFFRIANKPARGLGKKSLCLLREELEKGEFDVWRTLKKTCTYFSCATQAKVGKLLQAVESFRDDLYDLLPKEKKSANLSVAIEKLFRDINLFDYYKKIDERELSEKLSNVQELISSTGDYEASAEDLSSFLERTELASEEKEEAVEGQINPIILSSAHASKGLEFDEVIISGLEEGFFPLGSNLALSLEDKEHIEEERRLLYVAMTRAKKVLSLSCCLYRRDLKGKLFSVAPSLFLKEIPPDMLKKVAVKSPYAASRTPRRAFFYPRDSHRWTGEQTAYQSGQIVLHRRWGRGLILKVWEAQGDLYMRVLFEEEGEKVIVPEYNQLEISLEHKKGEENE